MRSWAPAYSLFKMALNVKSCLLVNELKSDGISVNPISPGWIRTDMGGPSAPGTLEESADTIVCLATEVSEDITGQFLGDRKPTDW